MIDCMYVFQTPVFGPDAADFVRGGPFKCSPLVVSSTVPPRISLLETKFEDKNKPFLTFYVLDESGKLERQVA